MSVGVRVKQRHIGGGRPSQRRAEKTGGARGARQAVDVTQGAA